jgi:Holliday junction resolvasome RuvABC endonuclease subunit
MIQLGLDISTSNVGWCLLDTTTHDLISAGAIELSKKNNIFEKSHEVRNVLRDLNSRYSISNIAIEENLQAFRPGFSSAKTIVTLARFNGIVTLIAAEEIGSHPTFVNVNSARRLAGLKIIKKSETSTKDQVLEFVKKRLTGYEWPSRTLKSGPRKGHVIPADSCYDIADAYIVAIASVVE